jgi:D-alanyl-D-alanine carboxypeptidase
VDLATGSVLYTQNGSRPLAPASNEKLPVAYAALVTLGPTYRIPTDVLGEGELEGTTWSGTLVLKGNGDPSLSVAGLRSLAAQVRAFGIRRVTGGVVGDETSFDARRTVAGWKARFYIEESPPLSALVVNRARVGRVTSRTPAVAAATAFRDALRAAGVVVEGGVRLGQVLAKTGTTSDASALSGYVGSRYAFTVLQNGHPLSYWWARRAQDRFVRVLAAQ